MAEADSSPASPPQYADTSTSGRVNLDTFFDIVPQTDQTSFQVGYLGLKGFRAWIKGDVLIKLDERIRVSGGTAGYTCCKIVLSAVECDGDQSIDIFSESQVLWRREEKKHLSEPSSSSVTTAAMTTTTKGSAAIDDIPGTLPFTFSLTGDLPHCVHLSTSSLEYRLTATLMSEDETDVANLVRSTQVHLTRYSRPGTLYQEDAMESLQPFTWQIDTPIAMTVQLQRTLFRRAEPISVFVRIPPPASTDKTLAYSLRSVEANLIRIITTKSSDAKHELLLAHSGKLCRLNSSRAIVLRLHLHPPFDASNMPYPHPDHDAAQGGPIYGRGGGGGCESITQDTLLHSVCFVVRVGVVIRAEDGTRRDVTMEREIVVLPGAAGEIDVPDVQSTGKGVARGAIEDLLSHASTSRSAMHAARSSNVISADEEEYDGYEDVGRSLTDSDDGIIRHALDDDEPPPTLLESQNDLQVEVDVEGVGAGVSRTSAMDGELARLTPPPPPTPPDEATSIPLPNGYRWHIIDAPLHPSATPSSSNSASVVDHTLLHHSAPPPPLPTLLQAMPASSPEREALTNVPHFRPPPYVSFTATDENCSNRTPRSADARRRPGLDEDESNAQNDSVVEESNPPAYTQPPSPLYAATTHHPPSYEA